VLRQRRGDHALLFAATATAMTRKSKTPMHACAVRISRVIGHEPLPRVRLHIERSHDQGERLTS
jgi:hypothetical protein